MKIYKRYIIGLRIREATPRSLSKYPKCADFCDFAGICYGLGFRRCYPCPFIKYTVMGNPIIHQFIKIRWMVRAGSPSGILGKIISKMYGKS